MEVEEEEEDADKLKANGNVNNNVFDEDKKDTCNTEKTDKMAETKVEEEHDISPQQGGSAGDRDHENAPLILQEFLFVPPDKPIGCLSAPHEEQVIKSILQTAMN